MESEQFWKSFLADVPAGQEFHFRKKGSVRNIVDLLHAVQDASQPELTHHITTDRNDVANWVEHVLNDTELATELRTTSDKQNIIAFIKQRINQAHAHNEHVRRPTPAHSKKVEAVAQHIDALEKSMKNTVAHDTKSVLYKYPLHTLNYPQAQKVHWKEVFVGAIIGIIFGLLLARISGLL